jgi:hypothetical protein
MPLVDVCGNINVGTSDSGHISFILGVKPRLSVFIDCWMGSCKSVSSVFYV